MVPKPCTGAVVFDGDGVGPACCVDHVQHCVLEAYRDGRESGYSDCLHSGYSNGMARFRRIVGRLCGHK